MSLVGILRGAVRDLSASDAHQCAHDFDRDPYASPCTMRPAIALFQGLVQDAAIGYIRSHYPQLNIPSDNGESTGLTIGE